MFKDRIVLVDAQSEIALAYMEAIWMRLYGACCPLTVDILMCCHIDAATRCDGTPVGGMN